MNDDKLIAELETLSDDELIKIWRLALNPDHPTRREELALEELERRGIDLWN